MSKLGHGQEVIDLLSSSDEEDGSNAPSDSKRRRRCSPPPLADVATNAAAAAGRTSAVGGQKPLSTQPATLVFISSEDGGDYCTVTEGLLSRLRQQQRRFLQTAVTTCAGPLLPGSESTLRHIQQNDAWSCGFRNWQMMLSAVVPLLSKDHSYYEQQPFLRDAGYVTIPSLKELQRWMESAWASGYDPKGSKHYGGKIVGKRSQIGAVEVSHCLVFSGIDCAVVQFIRCPESRSQLGPFCAAYFSKQYNHGGACPSCCDSTAGRSSGSSSRVIAQQLLHTISSSPRGGNNGAACQCPTFPIYLQWKGHSVTVVGVETYANSDKVKNLLLFDPAASGSKLSDSLSKNDIKPFRRSLSVLQQKDCQIVLASMKPLSYAEREQVKVDPDGHCLTAAEEVVHRNHC